MISNSKVLRVISLVRLMSIIILFLIYSCSPPQQNIIKSLEKSADLIKERKANEALALLKHSLKRAENFPKKIRFKFSETDKAFKTLLDSISISQIPISDKIEIYEIFYQIAQVLRFAVDPKLNVGIMASSDDFQKNQKILKSINQYLANYIYSLIESDNFINAIDLLTIYMQRSLDGTPIPGGDLEKLKLIKGVILSINKRPENNIKKYKYENLFQELASLYEDAVSKIFHPIESDIKSLMLQIVDAYIKSELSREIKHAFYSFNITLADKLADKRFFINLLKKYMMPNLNLTSFHNLIEDSSHNYSKKKLSSGESFAH